jgi:diguanylate cyclase
MTVPRNEDDRTLAFAEIAMGQIRALGQPATPRNFETGYKPALNQSINETLAKKGTLSEADLEQTYDAYIATSHIGDRIDTLGSRVLDEVKQVLDMVDAAAGSATSYSERLADASLKLEHAKDGEGLRAVIELLVTGAKEMELSNKRLETRLAASRQEIEQLQQNLETVRTESLTDPLTTLSNRKFFDSALGKNIADAKEKNQPLSLLMADIDHFKSFNDK